MKNAVEGRGIRKTYMGSDVYQLDSESSQVTSALYLAMLTNQRVCKRGHNLQASVAETRSLRLESLATLPRPPDSE